jgi:hypothetical protein
MQPKASQGFRLAHPIPSNQTTSTSSVLTPSPKEATADAVDHLQHPGVEVEGEQVINNKVWFIVPLSFYFGDKDAERERMTCQIREKVRMASGISQTLTMRSCSRCRFLMPTCIPFIRDKTLQTDQRTEHFQIILVSFAKRGWSIQTIVHLT